MGLSFTNLRRQFSRILYYLRVASMCSVLQPVTPFAEVATLNSQTEPSSSCEALFEKLAGQFCVFNDA